MRTLVLLVPMSQYLIMSVHVQQLCCELCIFFYPLYAHMHETKLPQFITINKIHDKCPSHIPATLSCTSCDHFIPSI